MNKILKNISKKKIKFRRKMGFILSKLRERIPWHNNICTYLSVEIICRCNNMTRCVNVHYGAPRSTRSAACDCQPPSAILTLSSTQQQSTLPLTQPLFFHRPLHLDADTFPWISIRIQQLSSIDRLWRTS